MNLKEVNKELSKAITNLSEAVASDVMASINTMNDWLLKDIEQGTKVIVENKDGSTVYGKVREVIDDVAQDYYLHDNGPTLYEYWDKKIAPMEKPVKVSITNSPKAYDYPQSKLSIDVEELSGIGEHKAQALHEAGIKTVEGAHEATQEELSEVDGIGNALAARAKSSISSDFHIGERSELHANDEVPDGATHVANVCPNCDESFRKDVSGAVESEDGEVYCSIECLNESILP